MTNGSRVALAYDLVASNDGIERGADGMPTAIRLFRAGANETTQGVFLFDAAAAEMIMADAKARGIDYMVDLEHLSLDKRSPNYDGDSRGWFRLAVRNGELWAVDLRWTADGMRRLSEKTQRYISPTFLRDSDNRVVEFGNIALVADPATYQTPALVAASKRSSQMTKMKDTAAVAALLATLTARGANIKARSIVKLADGAGDAAPAGKAAAMRTAVEAVQTACADLLTAADGNDMDAVFAAMDAAVKAMDTAENAIAAVTGAPAEPASEAPSPDAPADPAAMQMSARDRAELIALKAEKVARERDAEVQRLAAEMTERAELETTLGKCMPPAAVKLLTGVPLANLREMVTLYKGAAGAVTLGGPKAPNGIGASGETGSKQFVTRFGTVTLSANQLRECERFGAKPEVFAENQARLTAVKG